MEGERQPEQFQQPRPETTEPSQIPETLEAKEPERIETPPEQLETAPESAPEKTEEEVFVEKIRSEAALLETTLGQLGNIDEILKNLKRVSSEEVAAKAPSSREELNQTVADMAREANQLLAASKEELEKTVPPLLSAIREINIASSQDIEQFNVLLGALSGAIEKVVDYAQNISRLRDEAEKIHEDYKLAQLTQAGFNYLDEPQLELEAVRDKIQTMKEKPLGIILHPLIWRQLKKKEERLNQIDSVLRKGLPVYVQDVSYLINHATATDHLPLHEAVANITKTVALKTKTWYEEMLNASGAKGPTAKEAPQETWSKSASQETADFFENFDVKREALKTAQAMATALNYRIHYLYVNSHGSILTDSIGDLLAESVWERDRLQSLIYTQENNAWGVVERSNGLEWRRFVDTEQAEEKKTGRAERNLSLYLLEKMLNPSTHYLSDYLGEKLYYYYARSPETIPFAILNSYLHRDRFLPPFDRGSETSFFKFINDLSDKELGALRTTQTPGLMEVIRLVKDNPATFNQVMIENPELAAFVEKLKDDPEFLDSVVADNYYTADRIVISDRSQEGAVYYYDEKTRTVYLSPEKAKEFLSEVSFTDGETIARGEESFARLMRALAKVELKDREIKKDETGSAKGIFQSELTHSGRKEYYLIPPEKLQHFLKQQGYAEDLFEDAKRFVPNPVRNEIEQVVARLGLHYLESGDTQKQLYAVKVLQNLDANLGAGYEVMFKKLLEHPGTPLGTTILDCLIHHAFLKHRKAIEVLLEGRSRFVGDAYETTLKSQVAGMIESFIGEKWVDPLYIDGLSELVGWEPTALRKTLEFLAEHKTLYQSKDRPFNLQLLEMYRQLSEMDSIDQKLAELPDDTLEILGQYRQLKIFLACAGETQKFSRINSIINDNYFKEGADARDGLNNFLGRFESGRYPEDLFVRVMTASNEARNVRRLFANLMSFEDMQGILLPNQKAGYKFLGEGKYEELFKRLREKFVASAVELLSYGEAEGLSAELTTKVEQILSEDEGFESDFGVMTNSIGIYAEKYPPQVSETNRQNFSELMRAVRQTLELAVMRDPEAYKQERFRRSQGQFDRIFQQLPDLDRGAIEQAWLDTLFSRSDTLDPTTHSQKEVLDNKLREIRTTFETEILPNLTALFKEKLTNLEALAESGGEKETTFKNRLDIFNKYLLDEHGQLRTDIVNMYRGLAKDIRSHSALLRSEATEKTEKSQLSKRLGPMRYLKDVMKGVYKLGTIRPERIYGRVDYAKDISDIINLLSPNLHKLAIVDKEKKAAEGPGNNLELELNDSLRHLEQVISEEDHPKKINIKTQFATDFNSLARCPELTGSCQRLTEVTQHNESAYSRILDGINELVDLWEVKISKDSKGRSTAERKQRLARCFAELTVIKIPGEEQPRPAVLLDRVYTHPQYSTFTGKFEENIIRTALERFKGEKEISILLLDVQFSGYGDLIESWAKNEGYTARRIGGVGYFVNESNLKIDKGKYYDSLGGHTDTTASHYVAGGSGYILEH